MKKFLSIIICACAVCLSVQQASAQAPLYDDSIGSRAIDVLDIIDFYYSNWLGQRNCTMINDALARIQMELRPGQTVDALLIATGDASRPIFQRAVPSGANGGVFLSNGEWVVGRVTLTGRTRYYSATPMKLYVPTRSEFETAISRSFSSNVTYGDYTFLITALSEMLPSTRVVGGYMHDILDNTALAGANGTVILTANKYDSTYRIYDAANNRSDSNSYPKGSQLSGMGNTVWVLCASNSGEYVLVYTDLNRINVRVGDRVQAGSTRIGQWSDAETKGFSLYRVHGPKQYFLRPDGSPKPYPILLNY